jgi:hypothetical protein
MGLVDELGPSAAGKVRGPRISGLFSALGAAAVRYPIACFRSFAYESSNYGTVHNANLSRQRMPYERRTSVNQVIFLTGFLLTLQEPATSSTSYLVCDRSPLDRGASAGERCVP